MQARPMGLVAHGASGFCTWLELLEFPALVSRHSTYSSWSHAAGSAAIATPPQAEVMQQVQPHLHRERL